MSDVSNVPLRVKTQITEEHKTVQLERFDTVAGKDVKRRLKCPVIEDQACPELTLYMHHEFMEVLSRHDAAQPYNRSPAI